MCLKMLRTLIILVSVHHVLSFNINRDDDLKICEVVKKFKSCFPEENQVMIHLDGPYIELNIKQSENFIELKCHQRRELKNSLLENFPKLNLTKIQKLKITRCVLGESSFLKNFLDRINAENLKKIEFDLKFKKEMEITPETFDGLENVTEMKMNAEKHHNLRSDSFKKFEMLTVLSLHVYDVIEPQIPSELFTAMKKLEVLSIVSSAAFKEGKNSEVKNFTLLLDDFMNLKKFSLEGVRWPFEMQLKLPKMVSDLTISKNYHLVKLGEEEFRRNDQIEVLNLTNNNLAEIHPKAFVNQENLQKIDLSFNRLVKIDEKLFAENIELEYVNLSNNNLGTLGL